MTHILPRSSPIVNDIPVRVKSAAEHTPLSTSYIAICDRAGGSDGDRSSGSAAEVTRKEAEVGLHDAKRLGNGRFVGPVPTDFHRLSSTTLLPRNSCINRAVSISFDPLSSCSNSSIISSNEVCPILSLFLLSCLLTCYLFNGQKSLVKNESLRNLLSFNSRSNLGFFITCSNTKASNFCGSYDNSVNALYTHHPLPIL